MDDKKAITIADVADALGVSKTTVSRAISGKGRIGVATRERVLRYIDEHDYKPNVIAQGLAQSRTCNICAVMPGDYGIVDLDFFQKCLLGIQEVAGSMGYDVLLAVSRPGDISSLERIAANHKVDGVILMRTFVEDDQIEFLSQRTLPFVAIGSTDCPGVVQIDHDHESACRELTSILLMKGFSRIALIGGDEGHYVTHRRLGGFQKACEEAGRKTDEGLLYLNSENGAKVDHAVRDILEKKADCVLCMDDALAGRALRTLREEHVRVPGDIRVASFYNSSLLENNVPSITSLSFDARELGMTACQTLLEMLEGREVKELTLLPYEVVLKESTK